MTKTNATRAAGSSAPACSPRHVLRRLAKIKIGNPANRLPAEQQIRSATASSWAQTCRRVHAANIGRTGPAASDGKHEAVVGPSESGD